MITIKWDDVPVQGSPFLVKVVAPADETRVRAIGPGLENGVVTDYQGTFVVETTGAGAGTLKIRIHGPRGAFKVEMSRDHSKDRNVGVRYNPTEPGRYDISVKWAEKEIPKSPFVVYIGASEEDLRRLREDKPNGYNGYADNI